MAELKREAARQGRTTSELVETALRLLRRRRFKSKRLAECGSCATPYRRATSPSVLETGVGGVKITVLVDGCGHAGNCIGDIVVGAERVIDTVAATACGAPFKSTQLVYQLRVVQQIDAPRINQWHQINIQVAFGPGRRLVADAEFCKPLTRPLTRVVIAHNLRDAVALQ